MLANVLAVLLSVGASTPAAPPMSVMEVPPGTRIRVRHDTGLATITGNSGTTLDLSLHSGIHRDRDKLRVRRTDARTLEVSTHGPATIAVPRQTDLEIVSTARSTVNVRGVHSVHVQATSGNIRVDDVAANVDASVGGANLTLTNIGGNVVVASRSGHIVANRVGGLVDVTTGNGNTVLTDVRSGVHVVTINGKTEISCAAGAIAVKDTSGRVMVRNAAEDVDIFTAIGHAFYEGALRPDRSYRLRTLNGSVSLTYAANGAGFTARVDSGAKGEPRQDVRIGDESARVVLDAVGGSVALKKANAIAGRCAAVPVSR